MLGRKDTRHARPPRSTSSRCRLLELPFELRLQIFEEALKHSVTKKGRTKTIGHLRPSLLRTCRSIHDEAKLILYATTKSITIRVPSQFCTGKTGPELGCTKCDPIKDNWILSSGIVDICGIRELLSRFPNLNDFWVTVSAPLASQESVLSIINIIGLSAICAIRDSDDGQRWKCYIMSSGSMTYKTYFPLCFTAQDLECFDDARGPWVLWGGNYRPPGVHPVMMT